MEEEKMVGLKIRRRADGSTVYYWVAAAVSRHAGDYPQKTVRLHGSKDQIETACIRLTSELKGWLAKKRGISTGPLFDGSLRGLVRMYQTTKGSTYHALKPNTRDMYDHSLSILEKECGSRFLEAITGLDIREWYEKFKEPAVPGGPERTRRAYQCMQMLRIIIGFGVVADIDQCFRLKEVLGSMTFHVPRGRSEQLTFDQVEAICNKAVAIGKLSIALAQALQFELTLRQIDVIGLWVKAEGDSGIVDRGQRWQDGLLWANLDSRGILTKVTSKTGKVAMHDTMAYPFLRKFIDMVPPSERIGPMIRSEVTGLPYRHRYFLDQWREIATAVGVPEHVWNRDSRAGGITEGGDAGANLEHLRHHANHDNIQTTTRYDRKTLDKTRQVAELRMAHRSGKNVP